MPTTHRQQRKFKALNQEFRRLKIDTTQFGFYDQSAFLKQEKYDPAFLDNYARWVLYRPRDPAYDQLVRSVVPKLSRIVAQELRADGSVGNCVGASGMLTPMLSRLGIWSFGLVGSTILELPARHIRRSLNVLDKQDSTNSELGHAWVVAPPFAIADSTIALQHWSEPVIRSVVPEFLAVEDGLQPIDPSVDDIMSKEAQQHYAYRLGVLPHPNLHHQVISRLATFNQDFPAYHLVMEDLNLRYCPTAVRLSEVPLEEIMSKGSRRSAIQIWEQAVEPAFRT